MRKIVKRLISVVSAAALLATTAVSALASSGGHSHGGGTPIPPDTGETTYKITINAPTEGIAEKEHIHYAAYQIFSGSVPKEGENGYPAAGVGDTDGAYTNPGTDETPLPITDIKWGTAFGSDAQRNNRIVNFVYALGTMHNDSTYNYAFSMITQFNSIVNTASGYDPLTSSGQALADIYYTDPANKDNNHVDFDKLAIAVAEIVAEQNDREWLQAFTDILGGFAAGDTEGTYKNKGYVTNYYQGSGSGYDDGVKAAFPYEITVPAGYYMVVDLSSINLDATHDFDEAYSARMLFVASNVTQEVKSSVPDLTKEIVRDGTSETTHYDTDVAGVGDEVKFRLTGTLPSNYDIYVGGYQYAFIDTLDPGLTYVDPTVTGVEITVTGILYDTDNEQYVTVDSVKGNFKDGKVTITEDSFDPNAHVDPHIDTTTGKKAFTVTNEVQKMTIAFPCLKEIVLTDNSTSSPKKYLLGYNADSTKGEVGSSIINVEYSAKVIGQAVVGTAGNKNGAQIEFSNNPSAYADTNYTTKEYSTVYTFGIDILKDDAASFIKDNPEALGNVQFVLLRPSATSTADSYDLALFNNGEITSWVSNAVTYSSSADAKAIRTAATTASSSNAGSVIETDTTGKINIKGLNDNIKYTLVEIKTHSEEYAFIDPFTFTLTAQKDPADKDYTGQIESNKLDDHEIKTDESASQKKFVINTTKSATDGNDGTASITVLNFKYTDLPSTGGIGVYIYYIAGGCVLALAALLFFLSKKKSNKKSA